MSPRDMERRRHALQGLELAKISDVARLANELQAAGETSRSAALREAERLQVKHGTGLTLKPTHGEHAAAARLVRPCSAHDQLAGGQCGNCLWKDAR